MGIHIDLLPLNLTSDKIDIDRFTSTKFDIRQTNSTMGNFFQRSNTQSDNGSASNVQDGTYAGRQVGATPDSNINITGTGNTSVSGVSAINKEQGSVNIGNTYVTASGTDKQSIPTTSTSSSTSPGMYITILYSIPTTSTSSYTFTNM